MPNDNIPQVGERFNPHGYFSVRLTLPSQLLRAKKVPPGAKLIYGRLLQYAGSNGRCYPAISTLAGEVGLSSRQASRAIRYLETMGYLETDHRFSKGMKISSSYAFLWHWSFEGP